MNQLSVDQTIRDGGTGYLQDCLFQLERDYSGMNSPAALIARELCQGIRRELARRKGRYTFSELVSLLAEGANRTVSVVDSTGTVHTGIVNGLEREDGSGKSFNVSMNCRHRDGSAAETFHVRILDES